ncbi:DUF1444 family protein [Aneurinibacillus thermoaerophilus]|uniref:DUF1444 family protein n=1 Tax=Aneurinibacillus thermoaerophilus TaxID=143495 RepID=UPI002E1D7423|nr:DUF1444 family protein [Aneurinibacillus thermoaerophilus]MED0737942.1 DUF1444 family protein [Aneurinibacillus thermoaerophilus]MED0765086.1 DUF1444 family protein [Aneurinibacillus thermoaerophilus]
MEENRKLELKKEVHQRVVRNLSRSLSEEWQVIGDIERLETITLRHSEKQGGELEIRLTPLFTKVEQHESEKEQWIEDFVAKVVVTASEAVKEHALHGNETRIYPVIRHPSFVKAEKNKEVVWREHTAETVLLYALDLETSYFLITRDMVAEAKITKDRLHELALANLARLESTPKQDRIGNNVFYFFTGEDSYSASRVLNPDLLSWMEQKVKGKMGVALPHQDVLIIADLADAKGAYILAQVAVDFSMRGDVPISPIPFMYENGELEPYMVMRHPKSRHKYPSLGGKRKRPPER